MITFTGTHVTREYGAPNIVDIAVQSMRMTRFSGSGRVFWPVGMHLLIVADLVGSELQHHALLHDAAEVCVSDVPQPMKTDAAREVEDAVLARIYAAHGLDLPTDTEKQIIKHADTRSVNMEGVMGCCARGFADLQRGINYNDTEAADRVRYYLTDFNPMHALDATGVWPKLLESRLRKAINAAHKRKHEGIALSDVTV